MKVQVLKRVLKRVHHYIEWTNAWELRKRAGLWYPSRQSSASTSLGGLEAGGIKQGTAEHLWF
jgi:hypothetical protein